MQRSIVLLEVIISLLLFSIIAIVSSKMIYSLIKKNNTDTFITENNLILESTRLFLMKNNDFTKVTFSDNKIYFNGYLLLENISKYKVSKLNEITIVNICVYQNAMCQVWKIKR